MTVISFGEERDKRNPHLAGPAKCLACKHEWVAVAPTGAVDLRCPSCELLRGTWRGAIGPEEGEVFVCNCGCDQFVIQPHRALCIGCGQSHEPDVLRGRP